ncbi:MAG: hypothetical protein ABI318_03505, partial [Chthoniobacteraceae bacterium]
MVTRKKIYSCTFAALAAGCMIGLSAQQSAQAAVSDEDFNALKQAVEQLTKKVQIMETTHEEDQAKIRELQRRVTETPAAPPLPTRVSEAKSVVPLSSTPVTAIPDLGGPLATHNFSVLGDAEVQFGKTSHQHGGFALADFAPIFLFRASDNVLFEAGFDFTLANNAPNGGGYSTSVNLSFATIDYMLNDYI